MNLNHIQLKVLSANIFRFFREQDLPTTAHERKIFPTEVGMSIPTSGIRPDKKEENTFFANISYAVKYCGLKEHTVRIKFKVDAAGRFLPNTWSYV